MSRRSQTLESYVATLDALKMASNPANKAAVVYSKAVEKCSARSIASMASGISRALNAGGKLVASPRVLVAV